MIRGTGMFILYLSQQTDTWSTSATRTLEITEDNSNENLFKKEPPDVFYKKKCTYLAKFKEKHLYQGLFLIKLQP